MIGKLTKSFRKLEEENQAIDHNVGNIFDQEIKRVEMIKKKRAKIEMLRKKRKEDRRNNQTHNLIDQ